MKQVLGYVVPWSVAPGERLDVHVSLEHGSRYGVEVQRVIGGDASAGGPGLDLRPVPSSIDGLHAGRPQPLPIGSCVVVPGAAACTSAAALFICRVRADGTGRWPQVLVHWVDESAGRGLVLELDGDLRPTTRWGEGADDRSSSTAARCARGLPVGQWVTVWAGLDATTGAAFVGWQACGPVPGGDRASGQGAAPRASCAVPPPARPLLLAARADPAGGAMHGSHFNGRIEHPALFTRDFDADALAQALAAPPGSAFDGPGLLARWDFSIGIETDLVFDTGPLGLHGRTVNLPARAVTGSNWHGQAHDWRRAPDLYAAIHFHADDLYDAAWPVCHRLEVPASWPSGLYTVRLRAGDDVTDLPFVVRPPRERATSPLAVLVSTATTLAYANYRFHLREAANEVLLGHTAVLGAADLFLQQRPDLGASTYDTHAGGAGCRFSSALRPVLNSSPGGDLWNLNADTHLLQWLDHLGQGADLITDEDLHREGAALLGRYRCLVAGSHPEYWTRSAWNGLQRWLEGCGRLMYLGGNGFYWVTGRSRCHPHAIEVRRSEGGARYWAEQPGEYHHQFDGEPGGLWARSGRTPQALVGLGTRAIGFDGIGHYEWTAAAADPRVAFAVLGLAGDPGAPNGTFGADGQLGSAAGGEIDATDPALGTPAHALVIARSAGHTRNMTLVPDCLLMPHPAPHARVRDDVHSEVVFFETPAGGAVFSVGSTNWLAALPVDGFDGTVARLTGNVLRRFLADEPFPGVPPTEARSR